jgi:hypothetical protein
MNRTETAIKTIFTGALVFSISSILVAVVSLSLIPNILSSEYHEYLNVFFRSIAPVGMATGFMIFALGLNDFAQILPADDSQAVKNVRNGAILLSLLNICTILGLGKVLFNIPSQILEIAGYALMIWGYFTLKNSEGFSTEAKNGVQILFLATGLVAVATILLIIRSGLMNIDYNNYKVYKVIQTILYYLNFCAIIFNIAGFAVIVWGWAKIKAETNAIITLETDIQNKLSNIAGIAGFVCALLAPIIISILILAPKVLGLKIEESELYVFLAVVGLMVVEGLILSIAGLFKKSKCFAITGLIISGIFVIAVTGFYVWFFSMVIVGKGMMYLY